MTPQPVDTPDLWAGLPTLEAPGAGVVVPDVWEDPVPLTGRRDLPPFPAHVFPAWLGEFVQAVAEETQTPVDLAGSVALAVLATAAGGRSVVHVRGSWREPTNLYTVVALPPGNRKTAVFTALTDPLYEAEKQLKAAMKPVIVEAELTARLAREAADKAAAKASSADVEGRDEAVATAIGLAQTAETLTVPAEPVLMADDSTPETVTSLIAEQGGRLSVMSDEGGIFDIIAGRYSSGAPNMEVFLKGHAGSRMRVNRQTRREYIDAPALTMGLAVQPEVLEAIGRIKGAKGRGLLGRFLYSLPESTVGYRKSLTDPVPPAVAAAYTAKVVDLTLSLAEWTDPAVIQLTPEATAAVTAYQDRVEPTLRARGGALGHISDWAAKLVGATARIAALLHLAEHGGSGYAHPVSETTMRAAIELGDYYTAHSLAVFDAMGADPTIGRARTILETLHTHGWGEVSKRDLMVKLSRSEFPTVADLDPALNLLEDHGYVRALPVARTGGRGRPPSPRYLVHPRLTGRTA